MNDSDFAADPTNWVVDTAGDATHPYVLSLDAGDGGAMIIDVTPGHPARFLVDPSNHDTTAAILESYNCGFASAATAPAPSTQNSASNVYGDVPADPASKNGTFALPNLVGATEQAIQNWKSQNHIRVPFGFQPETGGMCMNSLNAQVVQQPLAPGTQINNSQWVSTIWLKVACADG